MRKLKLSELKCNKCGSSVGSGFLCRNCLQLKFKEEKYLLRSEGKTLKSLLPKS